ncbi:MAG: TenA family protein, partial [Muribaculaceae bacterium]|nr:TenA family protein [Muribaculaceae bacterium]
MKRDSLKWSDTAWAEIENIYQSILSMPFVTELAAGTLSKERFQFYIEQDALYIESYSALLANIASRLQRKDHVESFVRFALDGIEVERLMHAGFLTGIDIESVSMTPTNLLYSSLLRAQVLAPVEVEAAAVLPCFWIYQRVGEDILSKSNQATNPYA